MSDQRPDPDALLARVQAEEAKQKRGKLKIFFGAAPGVGKTYSMLEAARKVGKEGMDVVVGYIEPHCRPETQALVLGLDVLPRLEVDYRGHEAVGVQSRRRPGPASATADRRRVGPHQRPRRDAHQAVARRDAAAGGGHRRLHDAERPAPRKPQRRDRPNHRRGGPRDGARLDLRAGRRGGTGRPRRRTTSWSGCARARSTSPARPSGRWPTSSPRGT